MRYLVTECPVCRSSIVYKVDVFLSKGNGVEEATVQVLDAWELRDFIKRKAYELFSILPQPTAIIKKMLEKLGLGAYTYDIIEEIKLHGAYEKDGYLYPV